MTADIKLYNNMDDLLDGSAREILDKRFLVAYTPFPKLLSLEERMHKRVYALITDSIVIGNPAKLYQALGESVQNLFQHNSPAVRRVRIYYDQEKRSIIGIFPFNSKKTSAEEYISKMEQARAIAVNEGLGELVMRDDINERLPYGSVILLGIKELKEIGITMDGGKPYFFFDYGIN